MNDIELSKEDIGVEETITPSLAADEAPVPPEESTPTPAPSLADAQRTPVPPCGIFEALARAQAGFRKVIKNRVNPAFKSRYADLEAILDAVRPSLQRAGDLHLSGCRKRAGGGVLPHDPNQQGRRPVSGGKIDDSAPEGFPQRGSGSWGPRSPTPAAIPSLPYSASRLTTTMTGTPCRPGATEAPAPSISPAEVERLDRIAQQGIAAYSEAWKAMTASQKKELQKSGWHDELKRRASVADQAIKEA